MGGEETLSQIKINITNVRNDISVLRPCINKISNMKYGIATMKPKVDEKIAARMNVRSRFNSAYYMFDELETNLRKIENFANEAMDRYERAENNVQKQGEALAALFSMGIGRGDTINTIVNYVETQISEYNKLFFDIDELSEADENDKVEDNESYWHKAVDLGEEGLDKAKEAFESVADKVEDKVEEIVQEVETEVKDALSAFEGKIENIEEEIDKTFTNKDVEDIALNTGEFIGILGEEWNSTDSNELKELPQLQEECEDNIKSDASDLWKLYSKNDPDGAKTITNAIEDVAIAKKDLELGWADYKKIDPVDAGEIAGTYDFAKGLIVGTFNLVHGAGVQYYDLREDTEGTLRNWARFAMDVAPLANPGIPETEDDKILVASMEKDVEDNLINGDTYTRTRFVTDAALNVATFFDGVGEASVAGKLGEVSEAASDAGKVAGLSTAAEDLSKISSEANVSGNSIEGVSEVGKDVSDVTGSGIGKDTSNWGMSNEQIVQANASGETIPIFSENKFELDNKVVDNINKPMASSDIAVKSSEAITPKIDEVLVGSLAGKVAVNEASIESAANIIDKTSEAEEVRKVVGAGDETEIETSVNVFNKSGEGAEVGGKSVDEDELGSGKVNDVNNDKRGINNKGEVPYFELFNKFSDDKFKLEDTYDRMMNSKEFCELKNKTVMDIIPIGDTVDDSVRIPKATYNKEEIIKLKEERLKVSEINENTVMQKVIPTSDIDKYIKPDLDVLDKRGGILGGCVSKAEDTAPYTTNMIDAYNNLRLDYSGTTFANANDDLYIVRYSTNVNDLEKYNIPFSKEFDDVNGKEGWLQPFTGNGYTGSLEVLIPEYSANSLYPNEAVIFKNGQPFAYYDEDARRFVLLEGY